MIARRYHLALFGVFAAALAARLVAFFAHPDIYPDAFFQYLEPAWWKLHGYGWLAWEWSPSTGIRSWVPPGYYGAWMVLFDWLGIRDTRVIYDFFALHWCALSLLVVHAAFRIGYTLSHPSRAPWKSGEAQPNAFEGGLIAAGAVALCPVLSYYTPQTLIDSTVLIPFALGFADWIESISAPKRANAGKTFLAGFWLGLGACLRLPYAPLAALVGLDYLARARFKQTAILALGALFPILFFGAVDWATWGKPFHSFAAYIDYNFIQGRASEHGVAPWSWYLTTLTQRGGAFLALSALFVALGIKRAYKPALLAIAVVAYLSTQAHKEERFILVFWPLWSIAFGAGAASASGMLRTGSRWRLAVIGAAAIAIALCAFQGTTSLRGGMKRDYSDLHGLYEGQAFVGRQPDATGVLLYGRPHLNGGCFTTGSNIAFAPYSAASARLTLFNYAILPENGPQSRQIRKLRFAAVARFDRFAVYRRAPAQ